MRRLLVLLAPIVALVCTGSAFAAAPVLTSVGSTDGHPTATWTLPPGVTAQTIEVATSPEAGSDGAFFFERVVAFDVLEPGQTSWTYTFQIDPGTYYVHVAGLDEPCFYNDACPVREYSNIGELTIPAATPPASPPAVAPTDSLAQPERAWLNRLSRFIGKIERAANRALDGKPAALQTFRSCGAKLRTTVGTPPSGRLQNVYRPMKRACGKLADGARHLSNGRVRPANAAFLAGARFLQRTANAINSLPS